MSEVARLVVPAEKRIALIGSAPSSVQLAPYDDPTWTIWGCSPAAVPYARRVDAWFEMHPFSGADITPDYVAWMAKLDKPVYVIEPVASVPRGIPYPRDQMMQKYGPYFFTSSLSWMFALALQQNPIQIGLWGVDMSATSEYALQRPGCHYFITLARQAGVEVTIPHESDLERAPAPYGYVMGSPMYRKLQARSAELDKRIAEAAVEYENKRNEWHFLKGARDDLEYILNTWVE